MFRLQLDIPFHEDEQVSSQSTKELVSLIRQAIIDKGVAGRFHDISYRLIKDEDRSAKNYLIKDENGHCVRHKCKLFE